MSDQLQERFGRIQRTEDGNWQEVLRRVERTGRRRRAGLLSGLALAAVLIVPTALALHGTIIDFFTAEPAPSRVVLDFAQLDVGAPAGMETGVISQQARVILRRRLHDGRTLMLSVAPTRKGGFCTSLDQGGGGCLPPYSVPIAPETSIPGPITADGVIRGGPVLVSGSVQLANADSIGLRYADGAIERQDLTWVTKPIDAAFFVFDVPQDHWNGDRRPKELIVLDAHGNRLRTEPLHFHVPPRIFPNGAPNEALLDQSRKLIAFPAHTGMEAALWVAPTVDGRSCYWLRYGSGGFGGGCNPKSASPRFGLGRSQGLDVVFLWGGPLPQDIAKVEVRYEDGERAVVPVVESMVLYEIPPAHFPRGHRPELLIARDADGRELARQKLATKDVGAYPCKKPVPMGAGQKACP